MMRTVALAMLSGCELLPELDGEDKDSDDTGDDTSAPDTEGDDDDDDDDDDVPAGTPGWRALPLVDDASGAEVIQHRGNSQVRGIHFTAPDRGIVVTNGQHWTNGIGQAVMSVDDQQVTGIVFSGHGTSTCTASGDLWDVIGLARTADGYVVLTGACDHLVSHDDGASFEIHNLDFGGELVLGFGQGQGRTVLVRPGVVSETEQQPGPQALWTDIWAPYGEAPPLCAWGPQSQLSPSLPQAVYISADGSKLAYGLEGYYAPTICVSDDGGYTFHARELAGHDPAPPHGVLFTDEGHGIAYYANRVRAGASWLVRTEDGGASWSEGSLPASFAEASVELRHAFFAPGGTVGWIVGEKDGSPLLIKTTDGGQTWEESGGDLAEVVSQAGGLRLYTGFALDEQRLWLGGEYGVLVANEAGGE